MSLPYDGAISRYFEKEAPKPVRDAILSHEGKIVLDDDYPYSDRMDKKDYEDTLDALQLELLRVQQEERRLPERRGRVLHG